MERECGPIESKIWLIGDSEPANYSENLENPLDLKHPTVHNIFTPILINVQDELFNKGIRLDWNKFYVRNAVTTRSDWANNKLIDVEVCKLINLIKKHRPIIITPFGSRAFEFVRRALNENEKALESWGTYDLGKEFIARCQKFDPKNVNIIPLLHASICRGKFLVAHGNFCAAIKGANGIADENYFIAVGKTISSIFINNQEHFKSCMLAH